MVPFSLRGWTLLVAGVCLSMSLRVCADRPSMGGDAAEPEAETTADAISADATNDVHIPVVSTNASPDAALEVAEDAATNTVASADAPPPPTLWFPVGEELVYNIYWGVIPVGQTRITTEWIQEDGRTLLAIRYRTRSNRAIATLYPVNDTIEAVIEPTTFLPVRFEKNLREGRKRYHERTTFDHTALKAHWKSLLTGKEKIFDIDPDTRDLVTFMYYMRSQTFPEGVQSHYRVMADDKTYDLYLKAMSVESVKLKSYGRVPSLRLEPQAKFEGLFVRKGKMTVWVSRDARSLCTQVKAVVPVANVRVVLVDVNGPGDDQWVQRSPSDEDVNVLDD